jgi:pilus assembly protein CpaF
MTATLSESFSEFAERYRERLVGLPTYPHRETHRIAVATAIEGWLRLDGVDDTARRDLLAPLVDELAGLGPLEQLLADDRVTEILVNGTDPIVVEVDGVLHHTDLRFRDVEHLRSVTERMLIGSGRRIDDGAPMVDARLTDGSRMNAVLPPVAANGPLVTIRRVPRQRLDLEALVVGGMLDGPVAAFLHAAVLGRCNLVVSGGTGAGKTTLLAALAGVVPSQQRLVVLEDASELRIHHPHVAALEGRPSGRDGGGEVTLRDLVRNSLRMRPDRLIVGEVRGPEAADMLQAMNTGHDGSMTTLHANSAQDAAARLESMLAMAWPGLEVAVLRGWIVGAIDIIVHCERSLDAGRVITEVAAVEGDRDAAAPGPMSIVPLFTRTGRAHAALRPCGEVPRGCLERMARNGVQFPPSIFAVRAA